MPDARGVTTAQDSVAKRVADIAARSQSHQGRLWNGAFTGLHRLARPFRELPRLLAPAAQFDRLVVLALCRGIGDFAIFNPAYTSLREGRRGAEITVVVLPRLLPAATLLLPGARVVSFAGWRRLLGLLWSLRPDFVVDIAAERAWAPAIVACLSGANVTCGFYTRTRGLLYDHPVHYSARRPYRESLGAVLAPIGLPVAGLVPVRASSLAPEPETLPVAPHSARSAPRIALHPGGRDDVEIADKRWPVEAYARLATLLIDLLGAEILVLGSQDERHLGETIARATRDRAMDLTGHTELGALLHILERCDLVVCNNSAILHLAALIGVPTVSFIGPVVIERWGPPTNGRHRIVPNGWGGPSPIGRSARDLAVEQLRRISPERVMDLIRDALGEDSREG